MPLAGLPLDAAVVTFELVDGTRVWQQPVGGMALFVDKVGSMPEGFVDYYDQGGAVDPDELEELSLANPLVVLDREGVAIMRIEDAGHGRSLVRDPPQNKIRGVVWWCGDHRDGFGRVFGDDSAASG